MIKVAKPITGIEEYRALKKIILSGKFVSGKNVKTFESKFSKFIGTKYAVAVNNGTSALLTALKSLNIKKGDEVIVPSLSFASSATVVIQNQSIPKFYDIDTDSYNVSIAHLKKIISKKTKALIIVHFAGNACEMNEILTLQKKYKFKLIEDCAQAHGTKYFGKKVGSFGDASCFSFYATKHMTTGEGGIVCFNKIEHVKIAKQFINHGLIDRNNHQSLGFNFRMNEIQAAMGLIQLKKLNKYNSLRIKNSLYLLKKLRDKNIKWLKPQSVNRNIYHTYFWCPVEIISNKINTSKIRKMLMKKGLEIRSRYNFPLYKQKVFLNNFPKLKKIFLKNSEKISGNIFGLPNHHELKKRDLNKIIKILENLNV